MDYKHWYEGYKWEFRYGSLDGRSYLWESVPPLVMRFLQRIKEGKWYYQVTPDVPRDNFRFIIGPIHESKINFNEYKRYAEKYGNIE